MGDNEMIKNVEIKNIPMTKEEKESLNKYIEDIFATVDSDGLLNFYTGIIVQETHDRLNGEDKEYNRVLIKKYHKEIVKRMNSKQKDSCDNVIV